LLEEPGCSLSRVFEKVVDRDDTRQVVENGSVRFGKQALRHAKATIVFEEFGPRESRRETGESMNGPLASIECRV
jgi:hypothetical protein